jgi:hypothetical protein
MKPALALCDTGARGSGEASRSEALPTAYCREGVAFAFRSRVDLRGETLRTEGCRTQCAVILVTILHAPPRFVTCFHIYLYSSPVPMAARVACTNSDTLAMHSAIGLRVVSSTRALGASMARST